MVIALLGVIVAGHVLGWHVAGCIFALLLLIGWYFGFVFTSGAMPPVLALSIGLAVTAAVYPLGADKARVFLAAAAVTAPLAAVGGYLWLLNTDVSRICAVALNLAAVGTYLAAAVRCFPGRRESRTVAATPARPKPYAW